ncbi:class I SAM-dependent methyltransferase [Streptomyces nigra]|uniref:class I SAM-dependent methyltransferase n=1 Tax=Streptomyces nigra TaxID=1827580 RepID=UPI0037CE6D95
MKSRRVIANTAWFEKLYTGDVRTGPRMPWDIGMPQPAVRELAERGEFVGEVLDIGCGYGDNATYLASRGIKVTGLDCAPSAVAVSRERAASQGFEVTFEVADATKLDGYENCFDTVLDSTLYHCLTSEERRQYLAAITRAARPGARLHLFCFSNTVPNTFPAYRSASEENLRETVGKDWTIVLLKPTVYATGLSPKDLHASVQAMTSHEIDISGLTTLETDSKGNALVPVWQLKAVLPAGRASEPRD